MADTVRSWRHRLNRYPCWFLLLFWWWWLPSTLAWMIQSDRNVRSAIDLFCIGLGSSLVCLFMNQMQRRRGWFTGMAPASILWSLFGWWMATWALIIGINTTVGFLIPATKQAGCGSPMIMIVLALPYLIIGGLIAWAASVRQEYRQHASDASEGTS